jgi:hypothetical protein
VVEKRWISEASVGPEIAIFCNGGGSSMAEDGGERERVVTNYDLLKERSILTKCTSEQKSMGPINFLFLH